MQDGQPATADYTMAPRHMHINDYQAIYGAGDAIAIGTGAEEGKSNRRAAGVLADRPYCLGDPAESIHTG